MNPCAGVRESETETHLGGYAMPRPVYEACTAGAIFSHVTRSEVLQLRCRRSALAISVLMLSTTRPGFAARVMGRPITR